MVSLNWADKNKSLGWLSVPTVSPLCPQQNIDPYLPMEKLSEARKITIQKEMVRQSPELMKGWEWFMFFRVQTLVIHIALCSILRGYCLNNGEKIRPTLKAPMAWTNKALKLFSKEPKSFQVTWLCSRTKTKNIFLIWEAANKAKCTIPSMQWKNYHIEVNIPDEYRCMVPGVTGNVRGNTF